ncbi:hypothetical protein V7S43_008643 [Phytophthora oleae]|uniref:Expansin-like EG45 domain-containing protein n=1 Tax=Phytophthora oleae TaxID=2107226 RepID=A0ABD3FHJ7_9STRA
MKSTTSFALLASAATFAIADASEYFTGDGTAYTLGDTSSGNCNMMSALNFATTDYAALNNEQWSGLQNCRRCAEVSCADSRCADQTKSIVVQLLDRCPECKHGDLDLSPSVFKTLTGSDPSRYTVKWKFVDCPVAGNINYCLKGGSNNYWTAIQPTNVATKMLDGAYYYLLDGAGTSQTDLSIVSVSLTDVNGVSIADKVSLSAGSCTKGARQFPSGGSPSTPSTNTSTPTSVPTRTPKPTTVTPTVSPTTVPTVTTKTPTATTSQEQQTAAPIATTSTPKATTMAPPKTETPAATVPTQQSGSGNDGSQTVQQDTGSSVNDVTQQDPTQQAPSSSSNGGDSPEQSVEQGPTSETGDIETQTPTTAPPPSSRLREAKRSSLAWMVKPRPSRRMPPPRWCLPNPLLPPHSSQDLHLTTSSRHPNSSSRRSSKPAEQSPGQSLSVGCNTEQQSGSTSDNGDSQTPEQGTGSDALAVDHASSTVGADVDGETPGSETQNVQQTSSDVGADADSETPEQESSTSNDSDTTQQESSDVNTPSSTGTVNCPM